MLDFLTAVIAILNSLSTGKFIALMIVLLVAMVLAVVVLCLAGLAIATIIIVIYEWIRSITFKMWLWRMKRTRKP